MSPRRGSLDLNQGEKKLNRSEIEDMKRRLADRRDEEMSPSWLAIIGGLFWLFMSFIWIFIF